MDRTIAWDTKEWLRTKTKPRIMKVQRYVACLQEINKLIPYMPCPIANNPIPENQLTEEELTIILRRSGPQEWCDELLKQSKDTNLDLNEQTQFFKTMESIEE